MNWGPMLPRIRIRCLLVEDAIRSKAIPRMARDLFEREPRKVLPTGWKYRSIDLTCWRGRRRESRAGTLNSRDPLTTLATMAAGKELLIAELPVRVAPKGARDPVIVAFVDRCLGRAPLAKKMPTDQRTSTRSRRAPTGSATGAGHRPER